jgi:Mobilization protein NikA
VSNPIFRTKTVSTKVSDEEYAQLEAQAAERGVTVSEWCRETLLGQLKPTTANPTEEILLGEVIALRTILLNLQYGLASGEPLSRERMQELIDHADAGKLARARERLQAQAGKNAQNGNGGGNGTAA